MSDDSRLTSKTHRLFREPRTSSMGVSDPVEQDDLGASISASIAMIEKTAAIVESLQETVRMHEDTIYNQNIEIAQLSSQKEDAFDKLLRLEDIYRCEADKAAKAETQSAAMSERVRTLEQRNTNLTAQLDRVMQAVSKSFATRADQEIFSQPLRAVS